VIPARLRANAVPARTPRDLARLATRVALLCLVGVVPAVPGCGSDESGETLEWIRRGRVFVHAEPGATIDLEIEPVKGPEDFAYLEGPDGRTLERRRLPRDATRKWTRPLGSTAGTYTIVPSPSHRLRVVAHGASLAFSPEAEFPSLNFSGTRVYTFEVPDSASSFTLAATNQQDWHGAAASVTLRRPDGWQAHRFELEALDRETILRRLGVSPEQQRLYEQQGDTAIVPEFRLLVERHTETHPPPGRWEVEATVNALRPDDLGFWLEGIPNVFAPAGGTPRAPEPTPVSASIHVDPSVVRGPTGAIGAVWGWTVHEAEALAAYRTMGLSGAKNFYPQVDMEGRRRDGAFSPENDDRDPHHVDWDGYFFEPFRYRLDAYDRQKVPMRMLAVISRIAPWALSDPEEIAEYAEACVRYHQLVAPVRPSGLYWQFLNEPNHEVSAREYVDAFTRVGKRIRDRIEASGTAVRLGGPATGNAWSEPGELPWEWIEGLLAEADPYLDFVVWNQYRLGRLEDTWRYAENVAHADSLIAALDSDGQREEILIGATNLRGGIVLQNERQDGYYSALWWPSVMCHALGTGRVSLLNYFWLIDHGSRRKGLLFGDWSMKPVGHATAFAADFREAEVIDARTDHDGLSVLATRAPSGEHALLVVNRMDRPVHLSLTLGDSGSMRVSGERFDAHTLARTRIPLEAAATDVHEIQIERHSLLGVRWMGTR